MINQILNIDCRDGMDALPSDSIDIIFTDPPYVKEYHDQAYTTLAECGARVLKPGGLLFTYAGQYHLPTTMQILGNHLEWFWICSQLNSGPKTMVFSRKVLAGFKPILIYYKPPLSLNHRLFMDVTSGKKMKQYHQWEQSINETLHYLSRVAQQGYTVLDPFMGSGTNILAASLLGMDYIGMDIDPDSCESARARLTQKPLNLFQAIPEATP